jgi:hypothetical protein
MEQSWLTYREAADALNLRSADAAKLRAKRGRWPKRVGNDGLARVQIPEVTTPVRSHIDPGSIPGRSGVDPALILGRNPLTEALDTLREQLAQSLAREAAANERADKQAAASAAREAALAGDLAAERIRTDKAVAAFASLAERLDALAAARARPWWRRLVG